MRRRAILFALMLLAAAIVAGWLERTRLLSWYYLHELARAGDGERDAWIERVASLDVAAVPGLLACLGRGDERACANAAAALDRLAVVWGADSPKTADLAEQLVRVFPNRSSAGQQSVLKLQADWLQTGQQSLSQARTAARLLEEAGRAADRDVRAQALELASRLLQQSVAAEVRDPCRALALAGLQDAEPANRARAVRLAQNPELNLLTRVTALLSDPDAAVRQAVVLAVGAASEDEVSTDELLRALHDPDADVRRLCEAALRSEPRNFSEEQIKLSRLLTDARPVIRLQVLDYLVRRTDLEPGVWLRRLSHDPSPAVRAAALRTAAEQTQVDLTDRLDQMARGDPSPTVSQLARHYLAQSRKRP